MRQAARIVAEEKSLAGQFLTLGELNPRYEFLGLLGRNAMLLKDEILKQSRSVQGLMKEAREEGLERGREDAERATLLDIVEKILSTRFPGLSRNASYRRLETAHLRTLVDRLLTAADKAEAMQVLRKS